MIPAGVFFGPEAFLRTIFQDGWEIEDYVEEFLECWHLTTWDDQVLINCFVGGMDNNISQWWLTGDSGVTLEKYMDSVLWLIIYSQRGRWRWWWHSSTVPLVHSHHDVLNPLQRAHHRPRARAQCLPSCPYQTQSCLCSLTRCVCRVVFLYLWESWWS